LGALVTSDRLSACIGIVIHITYTTGTCTLPEYTHAPLGLQACAYVSGKALVLVVTYVIIKILLIIHWLKHCHESNAEKIAQRHGRETNTALGEASVVLGSRPMPEFYFFFILHEHSSALTGLSISGQKIIRFGYF